MIGFHQRTNWQKFILDRVPRSICLARKRSAAPRFSLNVKNRGRKKLILLVNYKQDHSLLRELHSDLLAHAFLGLFIEMIFTTSLLNSIYCLLIPNSRPVKQSGKWKTTIPLFILFNLGTKFICLYQRSCFYQEMSSQL